MDAIGAGAREGTRLERLVGFRAWQVKKGCLHSVYKEWPWPLSRTVAAECLCYEYSYPRIKQTPAHTEIPAPARMGKCGLYAYDRMETLDFFIQDQRIQGALVGVVLLWGDVIPGRVRDQPTSPFVHRPPIDITGYQLRAQYARILALDKDHPAMPFLRGIDQVERVSRRYLEPWAADACNGVRYRLD